MKKLIVILTLSIAAVSVRASELWWMVDTKSANGGIASVRDDPKPNADSTEWTVVHLMANGIECNCGETAVYGRMTALELDMVGDASVPFCDQLFNSVYSFCVELMNGGTSAGTTRTWSRR